jgi:uncharacterized membrane protein
VRIPNETSPYARSGGDRANLSIVLGLRILSAMARNPKRSGFPWRPLVLGPLAIALFALAMYFYNNLQPEIALTLLGFAFAVPMVWVVLAAHDAEDAESPVRQFVPRLTIILVLGSAFLGVVMRDKYPHIPLIEAGFIIFYLAAGGLTMRIFSSKPRRPTLTALSGGNQAPRPRREARREK